MREGLAARVGDGAPADFHGHVDPMGVAGEVETHGVDLTMQPEMFRGTRGRIKRRP